MEIFAGYKTIMECKEGVIKYTITKHASQLLVLLLQFEGSAPVILSE